MEAFACMVARGVNLDSRDNSGAGCLHLAVENAKRPSSGEREALIYLLENGADVHAKMNDGASVSDVAYTTNSADIVYKLGSYRGDLWDAVLAGVGYDIGSFRRKYPRTAKFTVQYTRNDFLKLWERQEHLCPYFSETVHEESLEDSSSADETETVTTRRSFESSIRQRTDISVTVDSLENVSSRPGSREYEGHCISSRSLSAGTAKIPLLSDRSLAHHLMPNPWHDIITPDRDSLQSLQEVGNDSTSLGNSWEEQLETLDKREFQNRLEIESKEIPLKGLWESVEAENVWREY
jgi:hypothetical protein